MTEGLPLKKPRFTFEDALESWSKEDVGATAKEEEMPTVPCEPETPNLGDNSEDMPGPSKPFDKTKFQELVRDHFSDKMEVTDVRVVKDNSFKLTKRDKSIVLCNECLAHLRGRRQGIALCLKCEVHLCSECVDGHAGHRLTYDGDRNKFKFQDIIKSIMEETDKAELLQEEKVNLLDRINVKHSTDIETCSILGMCVLESRHLAVADFANSAIKIVNVKKAKIIRVIQLSSSPLDLTTVLQTRELSKEAGISVTFEECFIAATCDQFKKILVLNLASKPASVVSTVNVGDKCKSLAYHKGKYMVICNNEDSACMKMIKADGQILRTVSLTIEGSALTKYLSIGLDVDKSTGKIFAFSDYDNAVICMDSRGRVINTLKSDKIWPRGMSVDPESGVYVCSWQNNTIYRLSKNLKKMQSVSEAKLNIKWPQSVVYHKDLLYISHGSPSLQNTITVLRIE